MRGSVHSWLPPYRSPANPLGPPSVPALPAVPTGPVAVSLQGVTFRYSAATAPALHDIWLDIPAGALVAVTGPVGAGKSALARALLGLYPLEAGQVLLNDRL